MSCTPHPVPCSQRDGRGLRGPGERNPRGKVGIHWGGASVSVPCPPRSLYALPTPTLGQAHAFLSDPDSQAKVSIMENERKKKKNKRASGDESEPFNSNLRRSAGRTAAGAAAGSKGERELPEHGGVGWGGWGEGGGEGEGGGSLKHTGLLPFPTRSLFATYHPSGNANPPPGARLPPASCFPKTSPRSPQVGF